MLLLLFCHLGKAILTDSCEHVWLLLLFEMLILLRKCLLLVSFLTVFISIVSKLSSIWEFQLTPHPDSAFSQHLLSTVVSFDLPFISFSQRFPTVMTLHYQLPPNLESVANFSCSVKIRQTLLSKPPLFSQGSMSEIIQCLFLFKFSQYYRVSLTSWDGSSFFPPGQKAILRGSSFM